MLYAAQQQLKPEACLAGFEHIHRFWDRQRSVFVAKILPGEFYVSRNREGIATTLGSCVSACLWDEQAGIGGMNHFMLPLTEVEADQVSWGARAVAGDATRYGNYAMEHLINEILKNGGRRGNLAAKVFGGGRILKQMSDVGQRNVEFVLGYLNTENIPIVSRDLGDICPRKVLFDPRSGRAWVKRLRTLHNDTVIDREVAYRRELAAAPVEGDVELF